eukprot:jgi/Botrbrau1/4512/Bobra.60_2s0003.1
MYCHRFYVYAKPTTPGQNRIKSDKYGYFMRCVWIIVLLNAAALLVGYRQATWRGVLTVLIQYKCHIKMVQPAAKSVCFFLLFVFKLVPQVEKIVATALVRPNSCRNEHRIRSCNIYDKQNERPTTGKSQRIFNVPQYSMLLSNGSLQNPNPQLFTYFSIKDFTV